MLLFVRVYLCSCFFSGFDFLLGLILWSDICLEDIFYMFFDVFNVIGNYVEFVWVIEIELIMELMVNVWFINNS